MVRFLSALLGIFMIISSSSTGFAQTTDEVKEIKKDIEALKEGQKALQKDIQEIKNLMAPKKAPEFKEAVINIKDSPYKGEKTAKLAVIEFSDYQCPFCAKHVRETLPQIDKDYIKTGKLKYVLVDAPLDFHKQAFKGAEAAHCAGDQGKYWEMHDRLFAEQKTMGLEDLKRHAQATGLDMAVFQQCLDSGKYADKVQKGIAEGRKVGVSGVPAFFIGYVETDEQVKAVKQLKGAQPFAAFKAEIDKLLSTLK